MRKLKNLLFYIVVIGGFSAIMYWIMLRGRALEDRTEVAESGSGVSALQDFFASILGNLHHSVGILLLQVLVIIIVARIFGWLFKRIGQPMVIGEIIAGIVLGPSLLGLYMPDVSLFLFPKESLGNLQILSQVGLILFMFVIGMELDLKVLKNKAHEAVVISHASIIVPFVMGLGLAYYIYTDFAPGHVSFASFGLFIGIAMSITAFPVLARIIQERNMQKTKLGALAITCAAADDITAWCILAAVIAIVQAGSVTSAIYTIFCAVIYVFVMIKLIRPFLKRIGEMYRFENILSKGIVAFLFIVLLLSSFVTETIGIHALFGAFMAGTIMPENMRFRRMFVGKIEDVSLVLFLPLFFVFSGLRTEIGLLNDPGLWQIAGIIILVAIAGKFIGSTLSAKFVGQNWKDSLTIGALMNTRGLMELVVLNIGYDLGVMTAEIFAIMVIMALVTTFMTGPTLDLINKIFKKDEEAITDKKHEAGRYRILLFFRSPKMGAGLIRLADSLSKKVDDNTSITAMHMMTGNGLHPINSDDYERESFAPVIEEAQVLNRKFISLFKITHDEAQDAVDVANKGNYDLLLMNLEESIFEGSLLGRVLGFTTKIINPENLIYVVTGKEKQLDNSFIDTTTRHIILRTKTPVGILIDKQLDKFDNILLMLFSPKDDYLILYAQKLIHNSGSQVSVFEQVNRDENREIREKIRFIEQNAPNHIRNISTASVNNSFLEKQDLIIISVEHLDKLLQIRKKSPEKMPSVLICSSGK